MSDVEQIMGLVQAENIQVHAESYDVALDMSFPKGTFLYSASYKIQWRVLVSVAKKLSDG